MKLLKILGIALGFGLLVAALSSMPPQPAAAGSMGAVTVANVPLPVQGTVNAAQSGTWNVGISGTPNVNVANASSSPVLARDVDQPARQPFQIETCFSVGTNPALQCPSSLPSSFQVPPAKELVIEYVSAKCSSGPSGGISDVLILNTAGGVPANHFFSDRPTMGPSSPFTNFGQVTRIYADPNTTVFTGYGQTSGDALCFVSFSGSLVNVP
jgi:hypothetical protein